MKKKFRISFILFCFISFIGNGAHAQNFNISWGDNAKIKYDFDDAVQLDNGDMIILKIKEKKRFGMIPTYEPILTLVDQNRETLKENQIKIEEKYPTILGFKKLGKHVFLLYENFVYSGRTVTVYSLEIDISNLAVSSKKILGSYDNQKITDTRPYIIAVSPDSSKLLMFIETPLRKNDNENFHICVYDDHLNQLWEQSAELQIPYKYIYLYSEEVSDDGKVFISLKHYDQGVSREAVKDEDGEKVPAYTNQIYIYAKDPKQNAGFTFNFEKKFIQGTKLIYNKNGTVTAAGLYKTKINGRVTGAFYATFNSDKPALKDVKLIQFPSDLVNHISNDDFGSNKESDPGLSIHFNVQNVIERNNGSVDLLAEYVKTVTSTSSGSGSITTDFYYGDIIDINIGKDEKIIFTRIPKFQKYTGSETFLSYYPLIYKDNLVLLYNDDKDNVNKDINKKPDDIGKFKNSVLVAAVIDALGNLSRQPIYANNDEDYITVPRKTSKISETSYLITADLSKLTKKRTRFGILKIN